MLRAFGMTDQSPLLTEGVVLLRGLLDEKDQLSLYDSITKTYETLGPQKHYGTIPHIMSRKTPHRGRYLLVFENNADAIPDLMKGICDRAFHEAHKVTDVIPCSITPTRINSKLYPLNSKLGKHTDGHDGWVVLYSLGCTCEFFAEVLGPPSGTVQKPVTFEFRSGDVLIFNGDCNWRVMHSVERIIPDTAPAFLPRELQCSRIGIQLRGSARSLDPT